MIEEERKRLEKTKNDQDNMINQIQSIFSSPEPSSSDTDIQYFGSHKVTRHYREIHESGCIPKSLDWSHLLLCTRWNQPTSYKEDFHKWCVEVNSGKLVMDVGRSSRWPRWYLWTEEVEEGEAECNWMEEANELFKVIVKIPTVKRISGFDYCLR